MRLQHSLAAASILVVAAASTAVVASVAAAEPAHPDAPSQSGSSAQPDAVEKVGEKVDKPLRLDYEDSETTQTVSHPGATYIKVHFAALDLASGDHITVSSPDGEEHVYHGAPGNGLRDSDADYTVHGDSGFAALSVEGDSAEVALHRASGSTAEGARIDSYWRGYDAEEYDKANKGNRSVCENDARRDVACYQESRPTEYGNAAPVARLLMGDSACTAFRVGDSNRLLTNNHCMADQETVASSETQFGFECATCDGDDPAEPVKVGGETMVSTNDALDYTLYSVQNFDSLADFGTLYVEEREPGQDERIYIPGHGDAAAKRLAIFEEEDDGAECTIQSPQLDDTNAGYMCDTSGGNSGSPVISGDSNKVIALHHLGGCHNAGTRMALIYPEIAGEIENG